MKKFTLKRGDPVTAKALPSKSDRSVGIDPAAGTAAARRVLKRFTSTLVLLGALGLMAGCASDTDSHLVSAPPPPAPTSSPGSVVATQPVVVATAPVASGSAVIVAQAPPVAPPEAVPPRPAPDYLWVPGYWTWRNERYEWMAGHWELPPRPYATWIPPRWEPENGSYRFYEGYWK